MAPPPIYLATIGSPLRRAPGNCFLCSCTGAIAGASAGIAPASFSPVEISGGLAGPGAGMVSGVSAVHLS